MVGRATKAGRIHLDFLRKGRCEGVREHHRHLQVDTLELIINQQLLVSLEEQMTTIKKPDANPIAAALLTWLVFGIGHIVINGQTNKWIMTLVMTFIGSLLCLLPGIVIAILSIVDSYQTAERLKNGEEIPENEYSNELLFKICKLIDKKATCKGA